MQRVQHANAAEERWPHAGRASPGARQPQAVTEGHSKIAAHAVYCGGLEWLSAAAECETHGHSRAHLCQQHLVDLRRQLGLASAGERRGLPLPSPLALPCTPTTQHRLLSGLHSAIARVAPHSVRLAMPTGQANLRNSSPGWDRQHGASLQRAAHPERRGCQAQGGPPRRAAAARAAGSARPA